MQTQVLVATPQAIAQAAEILRRGGLVGMPTETVYGLAANAFNPQATASIFATKGRPMDNPLIVHISDLDMLPDLVTDVPVFARRLAETYWPGPLTMILPKSKQVPDEVTAGLPSVAVRFPSHPAAQALIRACGFPLAAPSANLSGKPSPTTAQHVLNDLGGRIPLILDGGSCEVGVESTVVQVYADRLHLLRPGGITPDMLRRQCPNVEVDDAVLHQLAKGRRAASPGMKYKHYSPKANVVLLDGSLPQFTAYVAARQGDGVYAVVFDGEQAQVPGHVLTYGGNAFEQAQHIFSVLRELDDLGARQVFIRCPQQTGVGLAVYNRLIRAAAFQLVQL